MPKSFVRLPGRLRLNVSSQLDLRKATDGRQTVCGPANAFFRGAGAIPGAEPFYRTYSDSDKLITPPYGLRLRT
jgi:hypothetical protein